MRSAVGRRGKLDAVGRKAVMLGGPLAAPSSILRSPL